jgi:hypothetical protein
LDGMAKKERVCNDGCGLWCMMLAHAGLICSNQQCISSLIFQQLGNVQYKTHKFLGRGLQLAYKFDFSATCLQV